MARARNTAQRTDLCRCTALCSERSDLSTSKGELIGFSNEILRSDACERIRGSFSHCPKFAGLLTVARHDLQNFPCGIISQKPQRAIWTLADIADPPTLALEQNFFRNNLVAVENEAVEGLPG